MRFFKMIAGDWLSRTYLLLVGGGLVWTWVSVATWDGPDANMTGIVPLFLTGPTGLLTTALVGAVAAPSPVAFTVAVVLAAVVNAAVIAWVVRRVARVRAGRRPVTR